MSCRDANDQVLKLGDRVLYLGSLPERYRNRVGVVEEIRTVTDVRLDSHGNPIPVHYNDYDVNVVWRDYQGASFTSQSDNFLKLEGKS